MDKWVAASAGTVGAFYLMASVVAWVRVARMRWTDAAQRDILNRAVAWLALAVNFFMLVGIKLKVIGWDDRAVDVVFLSVNLTVFLAGLASVKAITAPTLGTRAVLVFSIASGAVGLLILLL